MECFPTPGSGWHHAVFCTWHGPKNKTATESLLALPPGNTTGYRMNQGLWLLLLLEHSVSFHHRLTTLFHLHTQQICLCPHLMQYAKYYDCAILYANISELAKPGTSCTAFKGESNITILVGAVYCMIPCGHFVYCTHSCMLCFQYTYCRHLKMTEYRRVCSGIQATTTVKM